MTGQEADIEGAVRSAATGWPTVAELAERIERWLPLAAYPEGVDALIGFLETAPIVEQIERLSWVTRIVSADYAGVAGRSYFLPAWLEQLRASEQLGAIACDRPIFDFNGGEASLQVFGFGPSVTSDGTWAGTNFSMSASKGDYNWKNPKNWLKARLGLSVKLKGAPKTEHKAQVNGSYGFFYGGVDAAGQSLSGGVQFPPGADLNVVVK